MHIKQRTCLKCGRSFGSTGPGNRLCLRCNRINSELPPLSKVQIQEQRGAKRHNGEVLVDPESEPAERERLSGEPADSGPQSSDPQSSEPLRTRWLPA